MGLSCVNRGKSLQVGQGGIMTYEQLSQLKPGAFKRRCGVHPETFEQMVAVLRPET